MINENPIIKDEIPICPIYAIACGFVLMQQLSHTSFLSFSSSTSILCINSAVATNSAPAFSRAYVQSGTVDTTTGFTLQVTYTSTNAGDATMSLIKQ